MIHKNIIYTSVSSPAHIPEHAMEVDANVASKQTTHAQIRIYVSNCLYACQYTLYACGYVSVFVTANKEFQIRDIYSLFDLCKHTHTIYFCTDLNIDPMLKYIKCVSIHLPVDSRSCKRFDVFNKLRKSKK